MTITKRITITIIAGVAVIGLLSILVKPSIAAYLITSSAQIRNNVIKGVDIRNGTITSVDLAANSVGSRIIKNGNVTTSKIANNSIGSRKLKDGNVTTSKLANNSVGSMKLKDGSVGDAEMIDDPTFDTVTAGVGLINYTSMLGQYYVAEPYTISDNGGGTPASDTFDPFTSVEEITCEDANGCVITMIDDVVNKGFVVMIINVGTYNVTIVDDDTTADLSGDVDAVLGHNDVINLIYSSSGVWIETGRSNN